MINYHTIILEQGLDRPGPRRYAIAPWTRDDFLCDMSNVAVFVSYIHKNMP